MNVLTSITAFLGPFEAPMATIGTAATLATAGWWVVTKVKNRFLRTTGDEISVDYMRLFGPSAVRMMQLIENKPVVTQMDDCNVTLATNGDPLYVSKDIWRSYCTITHGRKLSVASKFLWNNFSGKKEKACQYDFLIKPTDDVSIINWLEDNYIDQSGDIELPEIPDFYIQDLNQQLEGDLGFLFVTLKNDSEKVLRKIELVLDKSSFSKQIPNIKYPARWLFSEIKEEFERKPDPATFLDLDFHHSETATLKIDKWMPGEEFIILLSVYRSDLQGFENGYVDDAYRLNSIKGNAGEKKTKWEARAPLMDKSIREKIPYGWFRQ